MDNHIDEDKPTHIPVIIGNHAPFRLVLREGDEWAPSLDQINDRTYDYVKLSRMSTFIDIGIAPFSLGISFDGSLVLPATQEFRDIHQALIKFNETLGIMLLGGVYSEAVQPTDISYGLLYTQGYLKHHGGGTGKEAGFHSAMKTRHLGIREVIDLLEPKTITSQSMEAAYIKGKKYFSALGKLSPSLYLNGTTNYIKEQWVEALLFLWTAIEQVINIIWEEKVIADVRTSVDTVIGRSKFLEDYRTWTTSTRIELLYQKGYLFTKDYQLLNQARKTRNDFIHSGRSVSEDKVQAALESLFRLMSLVTSEYQSADTLDSTIETILQNRRGDFMPKQRSFSKEEVKHYLSVPPLPGDENWGNKEYELIEDLILKPLNKQVR
jgi:hypothetical protein